MFFFSFLLFFKNHLKNDYQDHCIGIDMGTSFSCVGVFRDGKVEIIANEHNNRITPSYFSFSQEGSKLFGEVAKNLVTTNPWNTIFGISLLIMLIFSKNSNFIVC